jgi:sugar lactone lactonase YvrE
VELAVAPPAYVQAMNRLQKSNGQKDDHTGLTLLCHGLANQGAAPMRNTFPRIPVIPACALALCLLTGCATHKKAPRNYTFFPAPPDEPRIQYLTGFSSEQELGGSSWFQDFVLGSDQSARPMSKPYGVTVQKDKLYICDTGPSILEIVSLSKLKVDYFGSGGEGRMRMPINSAVDDAGTRYVTDTMRGQVLIYAADDTYLGAIGKKDEMKPTGIVIATNRLYVSDLKNHNVRVYDLSTRELLFCVPRDGTDEKSRLFSPTNLAVDRQGRIYVSDTGGFFVKVFDADGHFVRQIGQAGLGTGQFALPKGIAVDHETRLYVVDAATQVVQLFDGEGRLLMFFGDTAQGGDGSTYLPAGIAVDYDNIRQFQKYAAPGFKIEYLIFVTNQYGRHKVNVYGFGRRH